MHLPLLDGVIGSSEVLCHSVAYIVSESASEAIERDIARGSKRHILIFFISLSLSLSRIVAYASVKLAPALALIQYGDLRGGAKEIVRKCERLKETFVKRKQTNRNEKSEIAWTPRFDGQEESGLSP